MTTASVRRSGIFPGGYSPAVSEVMSAVEQSGLWATDLEILRLHYAATLAHWRANLDRHREQSRRLYDERFVRMFEFYLAGSELSFRRMRLINWQLQLTRRRGHAADQPRLHVRSRARCRRGRAVGGSRSCDQLGWWAQSQRGTVPQPEQHTTMLEDTPTTRRRMPLQR